MRAHKRSSGENRTITALRYEVRPELHLASVSFAHLDPVRKGVAANDGPP